MSSQASTMYDAIRARLQAYFPSASGWFELPNSYKIETNPENMLVKGYALAVSPGQGTNLVQSSRYSVRRQFTVTISRVLDANENDIDTKRTIEKTLLDDLQGVISDLNSNLNSLIFESDGGIQFYDGKSDKFLILEATVSVQYFEQF